MGRLSPLAGTVAAVLWVVSLFMLEGAGNPAGSTTGEEIARFYDEQRGMVLAASTLHALAGFFFLWFVGALWPLLEVSDSPRWLAAATVVGGTAAGALMLLMMGGHSTAATTDTPLLTPDAAIVFWRVAHGVFVAAELAFALFVGALSLLALRGFLLPRWLGWTGLVLAVILLIPPIGWIGVLFLLPVWLVAVSVRLFLSGAASS